MIGFKSGLALFVTAALALAFDSASAQTSCEQDRLPAALPIDSMIFQAEVLEPVIEEGEREPPAMRVAVIDAALLPHSKKGFDLVLFRLDEECRPLSLSRQELIDRFVTTERIRVVAREGDLEAGRLRVPASWVSSGEAVRTQTVQDVYDYFFALLRIERMDSDGQRVPVLRSIAQYVEDPVLFRQITERQLESKRLRKQVIGMHRALNEPP